MQAAIGDSQSTSNTTSTAPHSRSAAGMMAMMAATRPGNAPSSATPRRQSPPGVAAAAIYVLCTPKDDLALPPRSAELLERYRPYAA